ncbi:hypothetical protein WKW80_33290 [Variovorax humicola]|uniref:Uncharacterized protein n=1 Tax=Variovorax humicola TaxID=1769758 RepID=A0ABU8W9W8_9BURK
MTAYATEPFSFSGCDFMCTAYRVDHTTFQPRVLYLRGMANVQQAELPPGTDPYASAAEALRHAEQQAIRWVHDRTGDGQGRF